jgi:hypothetical protein
LEVLAVGTKNTQEKELEFLANCDPQFLTAQTSSQVALQSGIGYDKRADSCATSTCHRGAYGETTRLLVIDDNNETVAAERSSVRSTR